MTGAALLPRTVFAPRDPGGRARGIGLSLLVHAALVVAIAFGVHWRSHPPEATQAELWAELPQAAAARAVEPEPVPAAEPPRPAAEVVAPPPPRPAELPDAQIALEKARKEERARKEEQRKAAELERRRVAEAERQAAEKLRRQQEAEQQKKQQAAEERAAQQREAERQKNLQRIQGLAGAGGDAAARGTAAQSAGPSASYAGRIKARIRPNIVFADEVAGDPSAEVEVRAAPDGSILGRKLVKSSGVAAYDNAVLRAIDKTETLPRDVDGRVPPSLLLVFRVRD